MHLPVVQEALLDSARFWLDRGVDGFRLDALNHAMADRLLRNNPPAPDDGKVRSRPFDYQIKLHSRSHPGVVGFIEKLRRVCDDYGVVFTSPQTAGWPAGLADAGCTIASANGAEPGQLPAYAAVLFESADRRICPAQAARIHRALHVAMHNGFPAYLCVLQERLRQAIARVEGGRKPPRAAISLTRRSLHDARTFVLAFRHAAPVRRHR